METIREDLREKIVESILFLEKEITSRREGMKYRMENYYNCVDDYSYGGLCDKAAEESILESKTKINIYKEFLERGEVVEVFEREILTDLNNKDLKAKVVDGRYGKVWIYTKEENNKVNAIFVGCAKKPVTYEKKGYKVRKVTETVKLTYFLDIDRKLKRRYEIIETKIEDATKENTAYPNHFKSKWVWFAENQISNEGIK